MKKSLLVLSLVAVAFLKAGLAQAGTCTLTCPADINVDNDPGLCSAVVDYTVTTSSCIGPPFCVAVPSSVPFPSGSAFPVGTTTVECSVGPGICQFDVTVNDTEPPVVTCPGDINDIVSDPSIETFTATVDDNCPDPTVTCDPASGSVFPLGETTVDCQGDDASGNTDSCSFLVDLEPPVLPPTGGILSGTGCALNPASAALPSWHLMGLGLAALALIGFRRSKCASH